VDESDRDETKATTSVSRTKIIARAFIRTRESSGLSEVLLKGFIFRGVKALGFRRPGWPPLMTVSSGMSVMRDRKVLCSFSNATDVFDPEAINCG